MKRNRRFRAGKQVIVTVFLMVLITGLSLFLAERVDKMEEKDCFDRLAQEAQSLSALIKRNAVQDTKQLELMALIAAQYDSLSDPALWAILNDSQPHGMLSRVEMLLPDDTVLTGSGEPMDASGKISFAREAALGAHITDRESDLLDADAFVVRNYVPVVRDGQTVAMLCGVIELGVLPQELELTPYGGAAAVYLIDGKTGDFLLDTWHGETGNILAMEARPMAPGYDHEQLLQGLTDGESRYVVFVSRTIGEYLYFYYTPVDINQWRIALSVPESLVLATADKMERMLGLLIATETVCFALYFLWLVRYSRRESNEKQRQLNVIHDIVDVEKALFNAHEQEENVVTALEKVGRMTGAEHAVLWLPEPSGQSRSYTWDKADLRQRLRLRETLVAEIYRRFGDGAQEVVLSAPKDFPQALKPTDESLLQSLTAVPVKKTDGALAGMMAVCNAYQEQRCVDILHSVSFSFGLFCQNISSYLLMKWEGERDALTGLYNRNRYERDLEELESLYRTSLACVYVDVNGLHELNNQAGHQAGDEMLKTVSAQMAALFVNCRMYRIGGDEFVVLAPDMEADRVQALTDRLEAALKARGIYISAGCAWENRVRSFAQMVRTAEKRMYAAKERFYQHTAFDRRKPR